MIRAIKWLARCVVLPLLRKPLRTRVKEVAEERLESWSEGPKNTPMPEEPEPDTLRLAEPRFPCWDDDPTLSSEPELEEEEPKAVLKASWREDCTAMGVNPDTWLADMKAQGIL